MFWYRKIINWWLRPVQVKYSEWPLIIITINYFIKIWVFSYWTDNQISWLASGITTLALVLPFFSFYLLLSRRYRLIILFFIVICLDFIFIINYYFWSIDFGFVSIRTMPWILNIINLRGFPVFFNITTPFFISSSIILLIIILFFPPQKVSRSWVKKIEKKKKYSIGYFYRIGSFRLSNLAWTLLVSGFLLSTMFYKQFIFQGGYRLLSERVDDSVIVGKLGLFGYQLYDTVYQLLDMGSDKIYRTSNSKENLSIQQGLGSATRQNFLIITIPELNYLLPKLVIDQQPLMPQLEKISKQAISFNNFFPSNNLEYQNELALLQNTISHRQTGVNNFSLDKEINSQNTWTVLDSPNFLSRKYWSLNYQFNNVNFAEIANLPTVNQVISGIDPYINDFNKLARDSKRSSINFISLPLMIPQSDQTFQTLGLSVKDQINLSLARSYDNLLGHIVDELDFSQPIKLIITANNSGDSSDLAQNSLLSNSRLKFAWDDALYLRYLQRDNFISARLYDKLLFEKLPLYIYSPNTIGSQVNTNYSNLEFGQILLRLNNNFQADYLKKHPEDNILIKRQKRSNNPELIIGGSVIYLSNQISKLWDGNNCYDYITYYSIPEENCYTLIDKARRYLSIFR